MFKNFLASKLKKKTEMSGEKHSDSEFHYLEEQETADRLVGVVGILTNLKQVEITVPKMKS